MAERKTRSVKDMLKGAAPRSMTTRTTKIDDAVDAEGARHEATEARAPGGDPTKRMTQAEYDAEMKKQKARADELYRQYKAKKALGR